MQLVFEFVFYVIVELIGGAIMYVVDKLFCGVGAWTKKCLGFEGGSDWSDALTGIAVVAILCAVAFAVGVRMGS